MKEPDWSGSLSRLYYSEFSGRHVVVAGGASGIGACLVEAFDWLGANVSILDKKAPEELHPPSGRVEFRQTDLTVESEREKAIDQALENFGLPRFFASTVGSDRRVAFENLRQPGFEELIAINLTAPVMAARQLMEPMRRGGGGAMCLFTSLHGSGIYTPDTMAYGVAKAGLNNAITRLAVAAGESNTPANVIRVFGFCPGWVRTRSQLDRFPSETLENAAQANLVPECISPEDVVAPVVFLASRHARFFTGRIYDYTGGEAIAGER
jgi:NAD(P)-dependent dehydrogenase (short-subunit alcohol dehydrogenase family)